MNSLIAASALSNTCQTKGKDASLTKSMDGFLQAVNTMRSTVMVPSVLKDIDFEEAAKAHPGAKNSVIQAGKQQQIQNADLLLCYKMVDAISNDLVSGSVPKTEDESPQDEDRFVGFFRGQVQGFLSALNQMTEMANLLTRKYNESIGPK